MFMESGNVLSIRKAEVTEISTAWYIYIAFYYDYLERFPGYTYLPQTMSYRDFAESFINGDCDLYFAVYDSTKIGVLEVIIEDNYVTLRRIWLLPEYWDLGFASRIISAFESHFPDVDKWNLGTCVLLESDIEACQKNGWKTIASIKRLCDNCTNIQMEKQNNQ